MSGNLEKKVKSLEIQISKDEQYNRRNWIELSGIPDTINDDKLEERIIEACKDVNIDVNETDIEACHRLPVRRNAINIAKFVNWKHAESILSKKITLSSTDFSRLNINNNIMSTRPYVHIIITYGDGVKIYNEKDDTPRFLSGKCCGN